MRERWVLPVLMPVGILVVIAALVIGFSRLLLSSSGPTATAAALTIAFGILLAATRLSLSKTIASGGIVAMVVAVLGIGMVAGGFAVIGASGSSENPAAAATCSTTLSLVAPKDAYTVGFQQTSLSAPADKCFKVAFTNDDPTIAHNFEIWTADPLKDHSAKTLFTPGATIGVTGPGSKTYQVSALPAGTYFYRCAFHPTTMTGTLNVS